MKKFLTVAVATVALAAPLPAMLAGQSLWRGSQGHVEASVGTLVPAPATVSTPETATCTGDVVSVWRDDPTPCDVTGAQRLDIYGITVDECDQDGGEFVLVNPEALGTGNDGDPLDAPHGVAAYYVCEGADK